MPNRHHPEEVHGLEGPDYVTLVIEWDSLADDLERGTATASSTGMATKDPDWLIDEASKDSFPASDPPAWGSSRAAASEGTVGIEDIGIETNKIKRRSRTPILLGALGVAVLAGGLVFGIRLLRNR